jgi:sugar phosphate isomerase/epimerase
VIKKSIHFLREVTHETRYFYAVEMLRAAGRYLMALHIHDNHGERDEHLLPGRGNIAWQEVMQALRETNYSGVFMYELGRAEDLGEVRANFEALNG